MKFLAIISLILVLSSAQNLKANQDNLELAMDGFWNEIGLPNPTDAFKCLNEQISTQLVNFFVQVMQEGCNLSLINLVKLINQIQEFIKNLDPKFQDCMNQSPDIKALSKKFGNPDINKIIAYISAHFNAVKNSICEMEKSWKSGQYNTSGHQGCVLAKQIMGIKAKVQDYFKKY